MVGKTLGHYEILEPLGAGGMGEVYLGEDSRLGRKVAIKVLPAEFASDPERLARFEQEARAAAALNHPHIAAVFDVGTEGDTHFMVQEYLEGQSLRERLDKGALHLDKALDLAIEVGEALIAAHKAGIIHRDLKPDNIFVTEEGHAKVLDFGLAKLTEVAAPAGSELSMSPTMLGTAAGQVMGTAGYMAPEQINGEEVDARADVFAFGCVLYEMASGSRPFSGDNVHETLAKILGGPPPPLLERRADLPIKLGWLVDKCLGKDPARRYQTAGDLVVDLTLLREAGVDPPAASAPAPEGAAPAPTMGRVVPWGIAALLAVALAYTAWIAGEAATPGGGVVAFALDLPPETRFAVGRGVVTISPDGAHVVFNASGGRLFHRPLNELGPATPIDGSENARAPFFSPDSTQLAFWARGNFVSVPIAGGPARSLFAAEIPAGASWGEDDSIWYGDISRGIMRGPTDDGESELIIPAPVGGSVTTPQLLPGGEWVLFTLRGDTPWDDAQIVAESLVDRTRKTIVSGGSGARYLPTGHLVYVRNLEIIAVGFDVANLEPRGTPVALGRSVQLALASGAGQFSVAANGTLVYASGFDREDGRLTWVSPDGDSAEPIMDSYTENVMYPRLSADGSRVLFTRASDVWIHHLDGRPEVRLTDGALANNPLWMPDETHVLYERAGGDMFRIEAAATGAVPEIIGPATGHHHPMAWDAEGRLIFVDTAASQSGSIYRMNLDTDTEAETLLDRPYTDGVGGVSLSPDGTRLAFVSNINGPDDVWVMSYPSGTPERVSTDGGNYPVWSRDGSELFFVTASEMKGVAFDETGFEPETTVFQLGDRFTPGLQAPNYDVAADARFLMIERDPRETVAGQRINVVLNWFEELMERVPAGR